MPRENLSFLPYTLSRRFSALGAIATKYKYLEMNTFWPLYPLDSVENGNEPKLRISSKTRFNDALDLFTLPQMQVAYLATGDGTFYLLSLALKSRPATFDRYKLEAW